MKKLILSLILIFGSFLMFAEPINENEFCWQKYEDICNSADRIATIEEYETLEKDACFGTYKEQVEELNRIFTEANKED